VTRTSLPRGAAILLASVAAWLVLAHLAMGMQLAAAVGFIALVALAAFGVGYEMDDPGTAAAMFGGLALAGVMVGAMGAASGTPVLGQVLAFGSAPAVIGAQCAWAGGVRRERC
jgi:hypothetical protein